MVATSPLVYSSRSKVRQKRLRSHRERLSVFKKLLAQNTDQFCQNTTLHGLRYLTDKELYPLEKIYFGIAFVIVVALSFYFTGRVIDKWTTTPVIFGINPKPTRITNNPFPAVTICNLNVASKSKAEQFSISSPEYAMLQMLCHREVNGTVANSITDWSHLNQFMTDISQPCEHMLLACRYGAVTFNCSELFRPIVTDLGLCCAFNMVHPYFMYSSSTPLKDNITDLAGFVPVRWTSESGYPANLPPKYYPRPAVGTGETLGLSVILDVESDEYYCSSANSVGFKIMLHSPTELPSLREGGLLLSAGRETKMRIRPDQVESEQSLRGINRRFRNCLFQDEEELYLFTHYTQRNCELECVAQMLQQKCGCISNYMPLYYGNETICSIYQSTCVERVRVGSMLNEFNNSSCGKFCLPSCYDISYLPEFFSTPLTHTGFQISSQTVKNISNSYVEKNIGIIHLYFKENSYRSSKQTEFFGVTDVLSNIGGLIGVFFGFSFISLAEFIFFAMIRPFRAVRQAEENNRSVILINNVTAKQTSTLSSSRSHYRRELGFKTNRFIDEKKVNISKLYMSSEFQRKTPIIFKKSIDNPFLI